MIHLGPRILAYLVAGMTHYAVLLRAAFTLHGEHGKIMRQGLLRPAPWLFLGVVLSWPIAAWGRFWSGHRAHARGVNLFLPAELVAFIIAGSALTLLN